jgi:nucleotide-binding universal stress UspA family protein
MTLESTHESRSVMDADPTGHKGAIVVGVDGSAHNRSAIEWAAHEADRSGSRLYLVVASGQFNVPVPAYSYGFVDTFDYGESLTGLVQEVKEELEVGYPSLCARPVVRLGSAIEALLTMGHQADEIVVGKRGLGAFARVVVGSTSIAVAGRSRVPVIVVPDEWRPTEHLRRPVAVGVDPVRDHTKALEFAFTRARQLAVPLHVVHAVDIRPIVASEEESAPRWGANAMQLLEAALDDFRLLFPDVHVEINQVHAVSAIGLLDAAEDSQLLVLGRSSQSERLRGFPFGSVGRAVLHYSDTPVAIVPM